MINYFTFKSMMIFFILIMVYVLNGQNPLIKTELNNPMNSELDSVIEEYESLKKKIS